MSSQQWQSGREPSDRRIEPDDDLEEFETFDIEPTHRAQTLAADVTEDDRKDATAGGRGQWVRLASLIVAVAALAGFGLILAYAYFWGIGQVDTDKLPIVASASEAEKVRPDDPGGLDVPYQETMIMNRPGSGETAGKVERLLPPPEEPQPPEPTREARLGESQPGADTPRHLLGAPETGEAAAKGEAPLQTAQASEPVEVVESAPVAPQAPAASPEPESAPAPATEDVAVPAPEPAPAPEAQPAPTPQPETAAAPARTQVAIKSGDPVIQLASYRSEDHARKGWSGFQSKFPDILDGMSLQLQEIDIEGKGTFFRVQTGPFPNKTTAQDMCAQLKSRGQACIVTNR